MPRIGRYDLGRVLGRGGAGTVYEAVLIGAGGLRKRVALKVLHSGSDALRREARLGGLLRHGNLVDVYEIGEQDGQWFCAMEWCAGRLSDHVPLPPGAVVEVGLQVCAALQYAHEELGLVHLDLKPENLLLADDGSVKVADLGIAAAKGFGGNHRIRGTPGYMAPEQGRGGAVDARTDVYALGVTLVELATGQRPGASETYHDEAPIGARETDAAVPAWLGAAVGRCLEGDPADRWPDMDALADALRALEVQGPSLRQALGVSPTVLAPPVDAFVGRAPQLLALASALASPAVVVIKGPAGIGKSRLALEAAGRAGLRAWTSDLTEASSLQQLVAGVSWSLGLPPEGGDGVARIGQALAGRGAVLLVLDGFDRLARHADVVGSWAQRAPRARLVVTTRVALDLPGASSLELQPLPDGDAVALLVARAAQRGAEVEGDPALVALARKLDGLPLALELAAGRLGVLSVADVLDRMDLSLLRRGTAGRHGTLAAALDWSWELLSEVERAALAQLSVFVGGFTLDAAEAVVDLGGASVVEAVEALVDRSMVRAGPARFELLTTVRAHAAGKLLDGLAVEQRHGRFFAALGDDGAAAGLPAIELDNAVAACRRAVARGDGPVALGALEAAAAVLEVRGPYELALELARAVYGLGGSSPRQRGRAALRLAVALRDTDRFDESEAFHEEAVAVLRTAGDPRDQGMALGGLGNLLRMRGRLQEAGARLSEAVELLRAAGHLRAEAQQLGNLAIVHRRAGRLDEARGCCQQALDMHRRLGNRRSEGLVLGNLGLIEALASRPTPARAAYEAALKIHREVGARRYEAVTLGNLGLLHSEQGRPADARRCFDAALALHRELGARRLEARVLGYLANLDRSHGRDADLEGRYRALIELHREAGDRYGEADGWSGLGSFLVQRGRLEEARACILEALARHRALGARVHEGAMLDALGVVHRQLGDFEGARTRFEAALAVAREVGNRRSEGIALGNLGGAYQLLGRLDEAAANYESALRVHRELGNRRSEGIAIGNVGSLDLVQGRLDAARDGFARALAIARDLGDRRIAGHWLGQLARVHAQLGEPEQALACLEEADPLLDGVADPGMSARLGAARAEVAWRCGDPEGARSALRDAEALVTEGHGELAVELERLGRLLAP